VTEQGEALRQVVQLVEVEEVETDRIPETVPGHPGAGMEEVAAAEA